MNFSTGHPVVDAVGQLRLSGNIVHHSWYQHIRYSNKRGEFTDPWAVLILADIVYWYRPVEIRDEQTGHLVGYRKKFAEDKLQRSPAAFSELFCCSEKIVRDALELLKALSLIDIELRAIKTSLGVIPTAMFIGLNPNRLSEITHSTSKPETLEKSFLPKSVRRNAEIGKKECRNGQGEAPNSQEPLSQMGNPSLYIDFSLDFSENPPLPPIEKKQEPALGDYGSKEPTPPTLEEEVVSKHQSQAVESESMDVNPGESKKALVARDNRTKRIPEGDAHFGQKSQERQQRSFAAKVQRTIIPIEEMEPWGSADIFQAFEAHLLAEAKKWNCQNPASYVAKKLQDISSGKAPRTEFNEWQAAKQLKTEANKQQPNLTPAQEAWIAIVSQIELVEDGAWVRVTQQNGAWIVTSNINGFSGKLGEVMLAIPLESIPVNFTHWYPECYRRAAKKFPHLNFPEPVAPINRAS